MALLVGNFCWGFGLSAAAAEMSWKSCANRRHQTSQCRQWSSRPPPPFPAVQARRMRAVKQTDSLVCDLSGTEIKTNSRHLTSSHLVGKNISKMQLISALEHANSAPQDVECCQQEEIGWRGGCQPSWNRSHQLCPAAATFAGFAPN